MNEDASQAAPERPLPRGAWSRDTLEFNRVLSFTDAVFAIALTLLVVAVAVPVLLDYGDPNLPQTMVDALSDMAPEFVSFFIAFILIGRYWMAHHRFSSLLRALDTSFIGITLIYLAFVAFLPFPTALVGKYEENPISVLLLALCLSAISSLEVVLFRYAYKHDLLIERISPAVYRYGVKASTAPVVMFIVTIPLAFVSTTLTLMSWMLMAPLGAWMGRKAPEGADQLTIVSPSRKHR